MRVLLGVQLHPRAGSGVAMSATDRAEHRLSLPFSFLTERSPACHPERCARNARGAKDPPFGREELALSEAKGPAFETCFALGGHPQLPRHARQLRSEERRVGKESMYR